MPQVDFYHLTARPLDDVLPRLAERVLDSGERLLILAGEETLRRHLDALLWSWSPTSFLAHGLAGEGGETGQPILLSAEVEPANGAANVFLADGRWRDEALAFKWSFLFFGSGELDGARAAWRTLGGRPEVARRYWKQDDAGRWREGP